MSSTFRACNLDRINSSKTPDFERAAGSNNPRINQRSGVASDMFALSSQSQRLGLSWFSARTA
ncbi:MAG: hypothetical protein OXC62_15875 [Aestuariivita sp.]|nr:hypothetical protein [Aestuariivita sp.]